MTVENDEFEKEETSAELTPRQVAFAIYYGSIGSETYGLSEKSAVKAGYTENSARTSGWRLLRHRRVQEKIEALRKEQMSDVFITTAKIIADIEHTRLKALDKGDLATATRCSQLQGDYLKLFSDRSNVSFDDDHKRQLTETEKAEANKIANILLRQGGCM